MLVEIRFPVARPRRQRLREGRAPPRRLGRGRRRRRALDGRRHDRRGGRRAAPRSAPHDVTVPARRGGAGRPDAVRGAVRAGRRPGRRGLLAGRRPARLGGLQAPPRARADAERPCAAPRAAPWPETPSRRDRMQVTMTVNGDEVTRDVEPRLLLVHFLRDHLGLTGTHWGCDTSNCGVCVVLMDGEPVKSCTVLAAMASRPRDPHRRGARARRRPRPRPGGLHGVPRPAMRVLHAGHDAHRQGAASPATPIPPSTRSARRSPARSAAAPATRPSSARSAGPPSTSRRARTGSRTRARR